MNIAAVLQLKLFPEKGSWGKPSRKVFGELFAFARDMFLTAVGLQLLNASQLVVISRTLGLSAAAVWSVANKAYPIAFQGVSRIFDFSGTALGELHIRGEQDRLRRRYADVLALTASAAIFAGATIAVCNTSFLIVWTRGQIVWPRHNDILLGFLLALTCVTRCSIGLSGYLKNIGAMRWIYFLEGVSFFVTSLLIAPYLGMTGILAVAILANVLCSGGYGFRRTAHLLAISTSQVIGWLKTAGKYLVLMAPIVGLLWWIASRVQPFVGLVTNTVVMCTLGLGLFWLIGFTPDLREEIKSVLRKLIR
jgi:O-antigen/teichoic acid export membrane protein